MSAKRARLIRRRQEHLRAKIAPRILLGEFDEWLVHTTRGALFNGPNMSEVVVWRVALARLDVLAAKKLARALAMQDTHERIVERLQFLTGRAMKQASPNGFTVTMPRAVTADFKQRVDALEAIVDYLVKRTQGSIAW